MSILNPGLSHPSQPLPSLKPIHRPDNEGLQVANFQWPANNALAIIQSEKQCVQMDNASQAPCVRISRTKKELPLPPEPVWEWTPEILSLEKSPTKTQQIFGLRKRTFWTFFAITSLLIITTIFAGVIGSLSTKLSAKNKWVFCSF